MAEPASVTLTQLREAFAPLGIVLDEDFVKLELAEDQLTVTRVVRTPAKMPACRPDGGVQCVGTAIPVVDAPVGG
jgi:hypothetical protein